MALRHGTHTTYANGCRCDSCRTAHAAYRFATNHRERDSAALRHGSATTYKNYGCRCADCREAQRLDQADYQRRRRA